MTATVSFFSPVVLAAIGGVLMGWAIGHWLRVLLRRWRRK